MQFLKASFSSIAAAFYNMKIEFYIIIKYGFNIAT
jgi:hypothetical protein